MSVGDPFPLRFAQSKTVLRFGTSGGGSAAAFRPTRLLCQIRIHAGGFDLPAAKRTQDAECLIDTGAPMSVFPKRVWDWWGPEWVQWLEPLDDASRRALVVKGMLGTDARARIGRVEISLRGGGRDPYQPVVDSPRFSILAKFLEEDSPFDRIVLGMGGGALEAWAKLAVDFENSAAYLLARA